MHMKCLKARRGEELQRIDYHLISLRPRAAQPADSRLQSEIAVQGNEINASATK